jgi:acyl carrier protein
MSETEIRERVWAYTVENFLYMRPNLQVDPDDALLRKGVFDSLGVMEVIAFLEETFGITVEQEDVTEAHFGTLNAIARYVAGRRALGGMGAALSH